MDNNNTQAAWQSRAIMAPLFGLIAFILQQRFGVVLPVEIQGFAIDLVPTLIGALMAFGIWARYVATKIIDRLF